MVWVYNDKLIVLDGKIPEKDCRRLIRAVRLIQTLVKSTDFVLESVVIFHQTPDLQRLLMFAHGHNSKPAADNL